MIFDHKTGRKEERVSLSLIFEAQPPILKRFQHDGPLLVTANVIPSGFTQAETFLKIC